MELPSDKIGANIVTLLWETVSYKKNYFRATKWETIYIL
jgi:hypothetical protein